MSLDAKVVEAIERAVEGAGQSAALARRLIAWLDAINSGNEDINDRESAERHLEALYAETSIDGGAGEEG